LYFISHQFLAHFYNFETLKYDARLLYGSLYWLSNHDRSVQLSRKVIRSHFNMWEASDDCFLESSRNPFAGTFQLCIYMCNRSNNISVRFSELFLSPYLSLEIYQNATKQHKIDVRVSQWLSWKALILYKHTMSLNCTWNNIIKTDYTSLQTFFPTLEFYASIVYRKQKTHPTRGQPMMLLSSTPPHIAIRSNSSKA